MGRLRTTFYPAMVSEDLFEVQARLGYLLRLRAKGKETTRNLDVESFRCCALKKAF
ncbi:hypothetical protein [Ectothiorhodospira shaposhnikovii]|uniref:hypothetical protein n=1 Tax=Ectothiorhodospira shaposhnikovii TaxID=1054 RepID=UPI001904DD30|nr:hypothetical protein [Ectothiorhodospira shaposhnikovii]